MKRSAINFAPLSPWRLITRTTPARWLLLTAAAMVFAAASKDLQDSMLVHEALQSKVHKVQEQSRTIAAARPVPQIVKIPEAQANAVNRAVAQLNLPWRDVLDAIEQATPESVALLALEPDARKHLVRGIAEARSGESMVSYVELLKRQPFFTGVVLTRHEINEQDANKPIRFHFEAQWSGT